MKKKSLALILAIAIVVGGVVAGTLAWLTDKTEPVVNTFTTSDINIELKETKNTFQMIPGWDIEKDPKVTVKADSEACYLFVKLEKSANFDQYMTYEMADGWTALPGVDGVYYREVGKATADVIFAVLKGDKVTVKDTVTKEMMASAKENPPTLTVTAYAAQLYKNGNNEKLDITTAWQSAQPTSNP